MFGDAVKTAQRILATALALFNEHGEASVSSVDIANECDMSPGNLYYHFKGKEQLVDGLMKLHQAQMEKVLDKKRVASLEMDDVFYYLFLIIQKVYLFRFLYRSPADLIEKYPHYGVQHARLIKHLESTLEVLFSNCVAQQCLDTRNTTILNLTTLASLIITQSCQYDHMTNKRRAKPKLSPDFEQYHALSLLITALGSRCSLSDEGLNTLNQAVESHAMPTLSEEDSFKGG